MSSDPLLPEALEANRRGELTDRQRQGFGALARSNHRSAFSTAAFLVAGAAIIVFFASPTASPAARVLIPAVALGLAVVLVIRAIVGADALTRDLRAPRVESVEGAIGKRKSGARGGTAARLCWLDIGKQTFSVSNATYSAAPDHGIVRLYFLPHSRKIVNLERLANPPMPDLGTPQGVIDSLRAVVAAPTRSARNEAMAALGGVEDAFNASVSSSAVRPATSGRDARPLAEAIVGTWNNQLMTVTFSADGRVEAHMLGAARNGRWSVDGAGRLQSDIMGAQATTDAWVAGDQLTISLEDRSLVLTRKA
jgi:hypothetical protein